jgi:hypothetical protein
MRTSKLALLVGASTLVALITPQAASAGILSTEKQRAKEELAIRLYNSSPVQQQKAQLQKDFETDPRAATSSGKATIERAVNSLAMAACEYAADEDADRPVVMWDTSPAHRWMGLDVPRSGYGLDNPDNVYRSIPLDGAAHYVIHGKITARGAMETFVLFSSIPGMTSNVMGKVRNDTPILEEVELAGLQSSKMDIKPDGTFTITVDSDPANGRPNHMQAPADNHHLHMLIRDSVADWSNENPVSLDIERVSGPPAHTPSSEAGLEKRAAEILSVFGPYWLKWAHEFDMVPVNYITPPFPRRTGWGFTTVGRFALADDEAWVVTLDPLGASYLGFAVDDPWGIARESVTHNGGLNQSQAKPNADGTYTYVIAAHDPHIYNWLDTDGLNEGTFQIRWQGLPSNVTSAANAVRKVRVVKLKELKQALPSDAAFVTASERQAQLDARARSFARRLEM